MLYVFHVDAGRMMTFDMSLALESVSNLKHHVQNAFKISAEKQVLLISGGECLDPTKRVCSYSAGTDTNPIFLFSKAIIEASTPPLSSADHGSDGDLDARVKEHCDMPVTLNTVIKRATLAQHFHEIAKELLMTCENLVHDQHLQQQGWSAVVANLEDITLEFRKRSEIFEKSFSDYIEARESYLALLKYFNSDLEVLQRIPVLTALTELEKQCLDIEVSKVSEDNTNTSLDSESHKEITLLDWISAADSKSTMDQLYEMCSRGLEQLDARVFKLLKEDTEEILKSADSPQMKEVKGLGERLSGLETLMREAKKYVRQQAELAQSFINNQSRASNTKDLSVLPDLCISHKKQLQMMADNHQQLCDIRRRCSRAKEELSVNLYHRLRWVMYIEDHILEIDQKLVIYHENLKRLRRHLEVLQQIHLAPATYLCAVAEVVRRRAFSQSFLLWASELACHLLTIHNEEVTRRKEFQVQFEGHFLNSLFPGMEDLPPSFATQAPSMFDGYLPKITQEDVDRLKEELPDLADNLNVPDTSAVTNFFLMKSLMKKEEEKLEESKAVEDKLVQVVSEVGLASNLDHNLLAGTSSEPCLVAAHGLLHLKDTDRGCESETDTEEFEKVGQSPLELNFDKNIPSPRSRTQDASTSTEVGERSPIPPKKPPRTFQKIHVLSFDDPLNVLQRTLSVSSTQSNTESFTNVKNPSLDSIDEFSCLKNVTSNTESCFNSHHHQMQSNMTNLLMRSKSISPHSLQSPKDAPVNNQSSPFLGHQPCNDFVNDEFYIDESLPSSLSIETGHSQGEYIKQLDTANNVVALLQDTLQISRSEHDKLKTCLLKLHVLANEAITQLKSELTELRSRILTDKNILGEDWKRLGSSWENLLVERANQEKELLDSLRRDHELEIEHMKKQELEKNQQIDELLLKEKELESKIQECNELINRLQEDKKQKEENTQLIEDLKKQLKNKDLERDKLVKEVTDRLNRDHKAAIENIRSRFKLMTMERSPSDTNLEKSGEFSSLPSHTTLLVQMTENFELDKEKAVSEALKLEREKWEKLVAKQVKDMEKKFEDEKETLVQEVFRKISEEKDKQIDVLMEREKNLNLECVKYKSTIQQLTETEKEMDNSELLQKLDALQREKEILEEEVERMKIEKVTELSTSVAVFEGKVDAMTSPMKHKEIMSRSDIPTTRPGRLNIESCKSGDHVLVLWDSAHESFMILQESKQHMYFLHSDFLECLGLEVVDGKPNKIYCPGEVVDKEYCHAKKSENRYKVPKGAKFFRVKVRPLGSAISSKDVTQSLYQPKSSSQESSRMSQSQSTISTISENLAEDKSTCLSLPSSPTRTHPVILEKDEPDGVVHQPEIFGPESVEKHFAEDSGIVDTIEQATAALDETLLPDSRNESESSDR